MKIYRENDVFTPWSAGFISFSLFLLIITIPLGIIYGIIRNLIERTENNRLGDGFAPLIITKNEFNIHDKDGIHIIPMKDIISVSGWR